MLERGFLDVNTFKDIISGRKSQKLVTLSPQHTVLDAIEMMKKYEIENIPVFDNGKNIGAISESGLFDKMLNDSEIKSQSVMNVIEKAYPEVSYDTPVERLSSYINKENGAVLSKDESGLFHIVTKYDIIQSLSK